MSNTAKSNQARQSTEAKALASIATMLGWVNVPPQHVLEAEIRALKSRVAALLVLREGCQQTIEKWREQIAADKAKIQELKGQDEWEHEQALAFRYGRQVECADELHALLETTSTTTGDQP